MVIYTNELYHYGVKGQRWGVRKKEVRADNAKAHSLGAQATIAGHAVIKSNKKLSKAQAKYDKAVSSGNHKRVTTTGKKLVVEKMTNDALKSVEKQLVSKAKAHSDSLMRKYGKENVTALKTTGDGKSKHVREKVVKGSEIAASVIGSVGSVAVAAHMGLPMAFVYRPKSGKERGSEVYYDTKRRVTRSVQNR